MTNEIQHIHDTIHDLLTTRNNVIVHDDCKKLRYHDDVQCQSFLYAIANILNCHSKFHDELMTTIRQYCDEDECDVIVNHCDEMYVDDGQ
jgi:hypothetical protein